MLHFTAAIVGKQNKTVLSIVSLATSSEIKTAFEFPSGLCSGPLTCVLPLVNSTLSCNCGLTVYLQTVGLLQLLGLP